MTKTLRDLLGRSLIYCGPPEDSEYAQEIWDDLKSQFEREFPQLEDPSSGCRIYYEDVREAMDDQHYPMSLVGSEVKWAIKAINQGIDSHLEICFSPDRGDTFVDASDKFGGRGNFSISPESMPTFLRRLTEMDDPDDPEQESGESPGHLVSSILDTLGFDEKGNLPPEDLSNGY